MQIIDIVENYQTCYILLSLLIDSVTAYFNIDRLVRAYH